MQRHPPSNERKGQASLKQAKQRRSIIAHRRRRNRLQPTQTQTPPTGGGRPLVVVAPSLKSKITRPHSSLPSLSLSPVYSVAMRGRGFPTNRRGAEDRRSPPLPRGERCLPRATVGERAAHILTSLRWGALLAFCVPLAFFQADATPPFGADGHVKNVGVAAASSSVTHDRLLGQTENLGGQKADVKSKHSLVKSWDEDDDDVGTETPGASLAQGKMSPASEWPEDDDGSVQSSANVESDAAATQGATGQDLVGDNKQINSEWPSDDDDDALQLAKQNLPVVDDTSPSNKTNDIHVAEKGTFSEWPDDGGGDDAQSKLSMGNEAEPDISSAGSQNNGVQKGDIALSVSSGEDNPSESNGGNEADVDSATVYQSDDMKQTEAGTGGGKKETTPEWPDDDDDTVQNKLSSKENAADNSNTGNNVLQQNTTSLEIVGDRVPGSEDSSLGKTTKPTSEWPEDDDDQIIVPSQAEKIVGYQNNEAEEDQFTVYHRNQSSESESAGKDNDAGQEEVQGATAADKTPENVGSDADSNGEDKTSQGNDENSPGAEEQNVDPTEINLNNNQVTTPGEEQNMQLPVGNGLPNEGNVGYPYDDEEEDSFFEMVKSTFNVLFLAAFFTSILVLRKRVMDRVHADPSLSIPGAIKDELGDVVYKLVTWAANAAREAGGSGGSIGNGGGGRTTSSSSAGTSRGGPETIPLSTATDEEWGWEDEDTGANLELSGIGPGDDAKEDDDLAMAIAMSLSEAENGGREGGEKRTAKSSSVSESNVTPSSVPDEKPQIGRSSSNSSSSKLISPKTSRKVQTGSVLPSAAAEAPSYSASGSDSIEDLLGQMGGTGGSVITSFGQKPKATPKPKTTPRKDSSDDIFASMGLSSYPSKSVGSKASSRPPVPATCGWQAPSRSNVPAPPTSAPLPSLDADTLDDDDADWGDDGDLDDLLDD
ncbi:hypothetical protein ACHAWF_006784 [Thalassiosira exigua]